MIDRALGITPIQQQSFYFQIIPLYLSIVGKEAELPSEGTTYRFSVWKGQQKFDQNKFPIQASFKIIDSIPIMNVGSCKLNFYLPSFNKLRKQQFTLRLIQNEGDQDFDIGQYTIDIAQLIDAYKKENKVRYEIKTFFSEDYQLDFQLYIEKTRAAVEKAVKESRFDRIIKSPLKNRASLESSPSKTSLQESPSKKQEAQKIESKKVTQKVEINDEEPKKFDNNIQIRHQQASPPQREDTLEQNFTPKIERQGSQKNGSVQTGQKVPMIQTKFKQLAKHDTPTQVKMKQSQRLSAIGAEQKNEQKPGDSHKQRIMMWLFLMAGVVVMYFAMHPNRKI